MSKTIENIASYRAPRTKIVDLVMSAMLCQTSNWAAETAPEEDQLP